MSYLQADCSHVNSPSRLLLNLLLIKKHVTIKTFLCYYVFPASRLFTRLFVTIKTFLCYYVFLTSSLFPCPASAG